MKQYKITLNDEISEFYDLISIACDKSTETILQDTLFKFVDVISRKVNEELDG